MNIYWVFFLFGTLCIYSKLNGINGAIPSKQVMDRLIKGANWNWQHKKTYAVMKSGAGYIDVDVVSKYRLDSRSASKPKMPPKTPTKPKVPPKAPPKVPPKAPPKVPPKVPKVPPKVPPKRPTKPPTIQPVKGNLALGKKATMSSQYAGFAASRGVNGKTTDFFHTRYQNMPWFRVDLGRSYNVQRVVLYNRKDCCGNRFSNAIISVGESLRSLKTCGTFKGPGKKGQRIEINCGKGIKGRFVQVQLRGRGLIHLGEVQVFGASSGPVAPSGGNLALGKKATMSSQYAGFAASLGVNGKTTDFFHTRYQNMPWFRVDLGRSYNVQRVVLYNRKDCCGNRFSNAIISVGESLRSLKTCGTFKGPGKKGQRIEINCGKGIKGRFVQVQLRGRGLIHLGEVQVFGASSGPVAPSGGNLALGKKATMSSQYAGFAASLGVNGKTTDFFHTRYQNMPWFRVDLGRSYNVQRVVLYNRKDCCGNRFSNAIISVGESLRSLKTCGTFKGPGKKGQRIEINCGKGIKGRFVQVQLRGRGLIHLGEVQVFGASSDPVAPSGGNLALGKKATMSSQYAGFAASLGVNGKTTDFFHTRYQNMPWFRVDLGRSYNVQKVVLFNRKDCCGNRFSNAIISVGESLRSMKTCGTFKGPGKKGQRIEINCGKGIKGRFVQVQLRGRGLIHLGEVQVY
uniref:Uncharacterized protein LOC111115876 isoform X2 n=1 Tax=Crassostrea virginica TaxID=6565 RepID=A0A8B8C455_CRAVI|nr:uncharacterized protein LOC111115876 isoform X2 [Crassostrea virginica]